MPIKKVKQSIVRCRECGASSQEAFLEKIKGTDEYICDDCVSDIDTGSYKKSSDDDDYDDDDDDSIGGGDDYSDDGSSYDDDDD